MYSFTKWSIQFRKRYNLTESAYNAGYPGSSPGSGRFPGVQTTPVFLPEILWTEESGRLQSMGSQRVGHDWVTNTHTHNLI